jgi:predicted ATP-dependent Lon-type protease
MTFNDEKSTCSIVDSNEGNTNVYKAKNLKFPDYVNHGGKLYRLNSISPRNTTSNNFSYVSGNVTIGDFVEVIGAGAFQGLGASITGAGGACSITSINIGMNVNYINFNAFKGANVSSSTSSSATSASIHFYNTNAISFFQDSFAFGTSANFKPGDVYLHCTNVSDGVMITALQNTGANGGHLPVS